MWNTKKEIYSWIKITDFDKILFPMFFFKSDFFKMNPEVIFESLLLN